GSGVTADPDRRGPCTPTSAGMRFRVLRPHARGGLGKVSVALDAELNREVALKEIQPGRAHDANSRARFLTEAEVTRNLRHPGVAPVSGLGFSPDGRPYCAMKLIRGESLKDAIERFHGRQGPNPALRKWNEGPYLRPARSRRGGTPADGPGERAVELRRLLGRF